MATIVSGCVSVTTGQYQPSLDTVQALRNSGIAPLNVGEFAVAANVNPSIDRGVSVRGTPVKPQSGKSFAQDLRTDLITDLTAAGKYDANASLTLHGELIDNQLHGLGVSTADATLAARFWITDSDRTVFDKALREDQSWDSSFIGFVAVPDAVNHYTEMYSRLLLKLYNDPDFQAACRPAALE